MTRIALDTSKLLGFRLLAAETDRTASLGAKVGTKPEITLGSKIGAKVGGTKIGAKVGVIKPRDHDLIF